MSCKVKYCRFKTYHITKGHRCGKCNELGHGQVECQNINLKNKLIESSKYDFLQVKDYCKVKECEHKETHTTESHKCSLCFSNKHSKINCEKNINNNLRLECPICLKLNDISLIHNRIYGLEEKCKACTINPVEIIFSKCKHAILCINCCHEINSKRLKYDIIDELNLINNYSFVIEDLFKQKTSISNPYYKFEAGMGCILFVRKNIDTEKFEGFFMHNDSWGQYGPETDERTCLENFINGYELLE